MPNIFFLAQCWIKDHKVSGKHYTWNQQSLFFFHCCKRFKFKQTKIPQCCTFDVIASTCEKVCGNGLQLCSQLVTPSGGTKVKGSNPPVDKSYLPTMLKFMHVMYYQVLHHFTGTKQVDRAVHLAQSSGFLVVMIYYNSTFWKPVLCAFFVRARWQDGYWSHVWV